MVVMLISGLAELISLGTVLPFLALITDLDNTWQRASDYKIIEYLGLSNQNELLIFCTFLFAGAALVASSIRIVNLWFNGRIAASVGSDLSVKAYSLTLYQPYSVHISRNTSDVIARIITQIGSTVAGIRALLQVLTALIVASGLLIGLLLIDLQVALLSFSVLGCFYSITATISKKSLKINSKKISFLTSLQLKSLQEGLGAIREVLLDGNQKTYTNIYKESDFPLRRLIAKNQFLGAFSRYIIEGLSLVSIAIFGAFLIYQNQSSNTEVIALLGAFGLGAQRLLPAVQQIYSGWAALKGSSASMEAVLLMLDQPEPFLLKDIKPIHHFEY